MRLDGTRATKTMSGRSSVQAEQVSCTSLESSCMNGRAISHTSSELRYDQPSESTRGLSANRRPSERTKPRPSSVRRMRRAVARDMSVRRATSLSVIEGESWPKAWITARPRSRPCSLTSPVGEPGIAPLVATRVVRVEVDEAALDLEVADLEDVAPAAGAPGGHVGAPGTVLVLAV